MKYTPDTVKDICDNIELGLTREDSARAAGISKETFYTWLKERPDFSDAVDRAWINFKKIHLSVIRLAAAPRKVGGGNDYRASEWLLERRLPDEFAEKKKTEHSGEIGIGGRLIIQRAKPKAEPK
jgi:hypothetical protein